MESYTCIEGIYYKKSLVDAAEWMTQGKKEGNITLRNAKRLYVNVEPALPAFGADLPGVAVHSIDLSQQVLDASPEGVGAATLFDERGEATTNDPPVALLEASDGRRAHISVDGQALHLLYHLSDHRQHLFQ